MGTSARLDGENAALALRQRLGLGDDAVDLEDVATRRDVLVFRHDFGESGPDGMYVFDGQDSLVVINDGKRAQRQRFTLAHELGHHELHRVRGPIQLVDVDVYSDVGAGGAKDPDEVAANAFAAHLLLPRTGIARVLEGRHGVKVTPDDVVELIRRFRVSWEMACWRLYNENLVSAQSRQRLMDVSRTATLAAHGIDSTHYALSGPRIPSELAASAAMLWEQWHITDERLAQILDVTVAEALELMERWDIHREDRGARAADAGERALVEAGIDLAAIAAAAEAELDDDEGDTA